MLDLKTTMAIRQFMSRVHLTGSEVASYNQIMMALAQHDAEARAELVNMEKRKLGDGTSEAVQSLMKTAAMGFVNKSGH